VAVGGGGWVGLGDVRDLLLGGGLVVGCDRPEFPCRRGGRAGRSKVNRGRGRGFTAD